MTNGTCGDKPPPQSVCHRRVHCAGKERPRLGLEISSKFHAAAVRLEAGAASGRERRGGEKRAGSRQATQRESGKNFSKSASSGSAIHRLEDFLKTEN